MRDVIKNYSGTRKVLIASGCSCTNEFFSSDYHHDMDCTWPKWPELLAEKLDMDYINLGHSGAGNEYIYSSILHQIAEINLDDIGLVIPAWTQAQRKDIKVRGTWRHLDAVRNYPYQKHIVQHGDINYRVEQSLLFYYSLKEICKSKKIPLYQFQMLPMFLGFDWDPVLKKHTSGDQEESKRILQSFYSNPYYDQIDDTFLGWPTENYLGGFNIKMDVLYGYDEKGLPYQISEIDTHPNAIGQIKIAEYIYEKINE